MRFFCQLKQNFVSYLRFASRRPETSVQSEMAPFKPRFLVVAPRTIATACLAISLSPCRHLTASPVKEKRIHICNIPVLFCGFHAIYIISAYATKDLSDFFLAYLDVPPLKAIAAPMPNHSPQKLVWFLLHKVCDEAFV